MKSKAPMEQVHAQNMQVCFLTQAMRGAVTPNWRSVAMSFQDSKVHLHFILECESAEDREEIQYVSEQFSIFQEDARSFTLAGFDIAITTDSIAWQDSEIGRMVYRRKEFP
jgi:hypothetical protein